MYYINVKSGAIALTFILAGLILTACGVNSGLDTATPGTTVSNTPISTVSNTPGPSFTTPVAGGQFANMQLAAFSPYQAASVQTNANVPAYSFAVTGLPTDEQANLKSLNSAQQNLLNQNGFVVASSNANNNQFYDLYNSLKKQGGNVFVSSDAVLHVYHILYDYNLRLLEADNFTTDLKSISTAMQKMAQSQYDAATGDVKTAALHNLAFFSVAVSLFDPSATVPVAVQNQVQAELKLIEAHVGPNISPLFGYQLDYSQYVPRGHYTRTPDLQKYFKAMMWYGQVTLHLRSTQGQEVSRSETRSALLMLLAMNDLTQTTARQQWQRIYETTSFMVGNSDDLNMADYAPIASQIYNNALTLETLNDNSKLDSFIAAASQLPSPQINGEIVSDNQNVAQTTSGFRFMGQRFIPDGYIMSQLMYNKVGTQQNPRYLGMGLDVPAAFGSARALDILNQTYQQNQFQNFSSQMSKLQQQFANLPQSQWSANLYWGWLNSLKTLLPTTSNGYPAFMQNQAWTDKSLNSFLGSWTELRHDTILYAKQPVAVGASAIMRPSDVSTPVGYLEPNPALYASLQALTKQTSDGLQSRQLLNPELKAKLDSFQTMLQRFVSISQQELSNQALSADDNNYLIAIGGLLQQQSTFSDSINGQVSGQADASLELIADVATDPNKQQVQEEGVGKVLPIYVIVPINGQPRLLQGGVFSYYEFQQPMSNRLTDEAWQQNLTRPTLPTWVSSFAK